MPPSTDTAEAVLEGARPFASAEEAWLWTMAVLIARRDGAGPVLTVEGVARPCEPDDVLKCIDRLYRQRRIYLEHARVLRLWGERQSAPDRLRHQGDHRLWQEALTRLTWPLQIKGIVTTRQLELAA
jgi:hypothetical protein